MSRSYKYPVLIDKKDKRSKRLSNKRVRAYLKKITYGFKSSIIKKKLSDPYDICDWKQFPDTKELFNKFKRK